MFCTNCGKELSNENLVCEYCGQKLDIEETREIYVPDSIKEDDFENPYRNNLKINKPIKTIQFFLLQLVSLIPVINIILLLIFAFRKNSNSNLKAYSRSVLIWMLIFAFFTILLIIYMLIMRYPIRLSYLLYKFNL